MKAKNADYVIKHIREIYKRYKIDSKLQRHMIYAAGVGAFICDNWNGPKISKKDIVATMLIHDLGNIVKYKNSDLRSKRVKQLKEQIMRQYGSNAHLATINMAKELCLNNKIMSLLKTEVLSEANQQKAIKEKNWERLICLYADWRVTPKGVKSLKERFQDFRNRYKISKRQIARYFKNAQKIEMLILTNAKIKPQEITQKSAENAIMKVLKDKSE
ncbi:MAG: hypothetical protein ACP5T4_03035 [Candidatus Micrarchaeia archaeon]